MGCEAWGLAAERSRDEAPEPPVCDSPERRGLLGAAPHRPGARRRERCLPQVARLRGRLEGLGVDCDVLLADLAPAEDEG